MGDGEDYRDKRIDDRVEILGELRGEVMVFQPMALKQLSHGGALVELGFPLHVDSLHDIRLTLGERSVVLKARVAHCRISDVDQETVTYQAGFEFIEPAVHVSAVVAEFLEAIRAGRRA